MRDDLGLNVQVYDSASDVGGTWWHNRYPGARVDGPGSPFYCYQFSDELMHEWDWSDTQPRQSEVLDYLGYVADLFDLHRNIQFNTLVRDASYNESERSWTITFDGGESSSRFLICALGALSTLNKPDIPGIDDFAGPCYHTGNWPHEPVSFEDKRVAVIGTGSSGIQVIPEIAKTAEHLFVLQRTPQYTYPARNRPLSAAELQGARNDWESLRFKMHQNPGGMPFDFHSRNALDDTEEQRLANYEGLWERGGFEIMSQNYGDITTNEEANRTFADFVRGKIREIVKDPETARKLMPDYFINTKRPVLDNGYYETYNRNNVTLIDLREEAIEKFTATGVRTTQGHYSLDLLILATGFDAISGSLLRLNPKGKDELSLKAKWQDRFHNYLGLTIAGFPNLFVIHGPGSPGVFYNMPFGAERQLNWIGDCLGYMDSNSLGVIEASSAHEEAWGDEVSTIANATLYPRTDSWWTGSNIPGKPRQFSAHLNALDYYDRLTFVANRSYEGFRFEKNKTGNAPIGRQYRGSH